MVSEEEIESFGFIKYTNNSVGENIKTFHKAVGSLAIIAKGFDIDILLDVDTGIVNIFDITKDKYPIFEGIIKNKSELKKVLEMLNLKPKRR